MGVPLGGHHDHRPLTVLQEVLQCCLNRLTPRVTVTRRLHVAQRPKLSTLMRLSDTTSRYLWYPKKKQDNTCRSQVGRIAKMDGVPAILNASIRAALLMLSRSIVSRITSRYISMGKKHLRVTVEQDLEGFLRPTDTWKTRIPVKSAATHDESKEGQAPAIDVSRASDKWKVCFNIA